MCLCASLEKKKQVGTKSVSFPSKAKTMHPGICLVPGPTSHLHVLFFTFLQIYSEKGFNNYVTCSSSPLVFLMLYFPWHFRPPRRCLCGFHTSVFSPLTCTRWITHNMQGSPSGSKTYRLIHFCRWSSVSLRLGFGLRFGVADIVNWSDSTGCKYRMSFPFCLGCKSRPSHLSSLRAFCCAVLWVTSIFPHCQAHFERILTSQPLFSDRLVQSVALPSSFKLTAALPLWSHLV